MFKSGIEMLGFKDKNIYFMGKGKLFQRKFMILKDKHYLGSNKKQKLGLNSGSEKEIYLKAQSFIPP